MTTIEGPPKSATRNLSIAKELEVLLLAAGRDAGIEHITISSGGQPAKGTSTRRVGSTRHDRGRAADLQLWVDGRALTFSDQTPHPLIDQFVTACAARGAIGLGAGVRYMGARTLHIGFGLDAADKTKLTWGAAGAAANAPAWLRLAAKRGWDNPVDDDIIGGEEDGEDEEDYAGQDDRYKVIARSGLKLRRGPGTDFEPIRTLPLDTILTVAAWNGEWAQVDLDGDGLRDGYVFGAYLVPVPDFDPESALHPEDLEVG